jgi:hypothetical protein
MNSSIRSDLTTDDGLGFNEFRNPEPIIELATALEENGLSTREAEAIAADALDISVMENENLNKLADLLDIERSTVRTHLENGKTRINNGARQYYMVHEHRPQQIIGTLEISSAIDDLEKIVVTVCRYYNPTDDVEMEDEEYVIYLSKYDSAGWNEYEYKGESVRRVTGRRKVLDEMNRVLKDFRSNSNPVQIIGELQYALDFDEGLLDPNSKYDVRMELVSPLCDPDGPPEEHDMPPHAFGGVSSVVKRFEKP